MGELHARELVQQHAVQRARAAVGGRLSGIAAEEGAEHEGWATTQQLCACGDYGAIVRRACACFKRERMRYWRRGAHVTASRLSRQCERAGPLGTP